jgi:lysylphosphatidylglycerol synthetase-like protein (DUF2156 family)
VDAGEWDALAPFVLRAGKSYFESSDGLALLAYRVRLGTAVVSGDPVGARASYPALVREFVEFAKSQGWRVAVLGAGEHGYQLWTAHRLNSLTIGRDVVISIDDFTMYGRRFRNLRQAVRRSHNAAVTVTVHREAAIEQHLAAELLALRDRSHKTKDRGFSMLLGNLLDGTHPDCLIAIARDGDGRPVAFQRYLQSGPDGLTLDLSVRDPNAPNGTDERLVIDVVEHGRARGFRRVSLSFAPFADLYGAQSPSFRQQVGRGALHLLDPFIRSEPLYLFLRKFHALEGRRLVMLRWHQVIPVALAMLLLEFR